MAGGSDALLVAYHRDAVEALNRAAREVWGNLGHLSGPSWPPPEAGVTGPATASSPWPPARPGPGRPPERAVVSSVDVEGRSLVATTADGAELRLAPTTSGPSGSPTAMP